MPKIDAQVFDVGMLDELSRQDTPVHRLDPRAKLITTLFFVATIASFGRYEVSALIPFFIFPITLCAMGNIPMGIVARKLLPVAPFALFVGIFNPILDRQVMMQVGPLDIAGGWVSFASIIGRFLLTISAALILISVTGFQAVCAALERLGAPRVFVVQLMFLYRYLFVLMEETLRIVRARALRSFNGKGSSIRVFGSMVGHLLLRTLDRAQRIHLAMICRGFDGEVKMFRPLRLRSADLMFVSGWSILFVMLRLYNLPQIIGQLVTGLGKI